jgi:hypothetical protein
MEENDFFYAKKSAELCTLRDELKATETDALLYADGELTAAKFKTQKSRRKELKSKINEILAEIEEKNAECEPHIDETADTEQTVNEEGEE